MFSGMPANPWGDNIQVCLDFHVRSGVRIPAGYLSFPSSEVGWPSHQDAAEDGAGAATEGRKALIVVHARPGLAAMSSKQPRSSPALQPGMKSLSCSAGAESTI